MVITDIIGRMQKLISSGAIILAVALCVAGPEDGFRNQMNRQSKKYETAMLKKDIKAFGKLLDMYTTKNFVYKENGQSMTKKQMFAQMSMSVKGFQKVTKFKSRILTAQVQGNKATCTVSNLMEGTMMGPDKKKHTMSFGGNTVETFVMEGKTWKMSVMEWKTMEMKQDGKVMPTPGA
jgi:hypothetical protein